MLDEVYYTLSLYASPSSYEILIMKKNREDFRWTCSEDIYAISNDDLFMRDLNISQLRKKR